MPDPGPQDEQREIGLLDVEDLRLEGVGGAQQAALPEIGFELDLAPELELQPLGDGERDGALGTDVSRRGHEHAQSKQRGQLPIAKREFSRVQRAQARRP